MPHIADKPFVNTLAEDIRYDPTQGIGANIGNNLLNAADKVQTRNMYRNRAAQMNRALEAWQQNQAVLRQRQQPVSAQQQLPISWPKFAPPLTQGD